MPTINDKCFGCGACAAICPKEAITIENGKAIINKKKCNDCKQCMEVCFAKAIDE